MASTGDPWVLNVQKWVNEKFRGKSGYTEITENGLTGWNTIYALLHGLQITLEVGSTANNFGNGTINAFNKFISENGPIQERTKEEDDELVSNSLIVSNDTAKYVKLIDQYDKINGIIQGALLCKGYNIGATKPTGHFYGGTAAAIKKLKSDAGIVDNSSEVTLNIMKSLMSMDYFYSYDQSEKTQNIISMQRYLNRNYEEYIGLRPCDGVYGRSTNVALIYAIQYEEHMPKSTANGNCGPATSGALPTLYVNETNTNKSSGTDFNGKSYSSSSLEKFKKLATIALYFNGYGSGNLDNGLNEEIIKQSQKVYSLSQNGKIDKSTWLSLLVSCGDTSRSSIACDTRFEMTNERIKYLKDNKYQIVGRYLTGGDFKELRQGEPKRILDNNLKFFPIFQESGTNLNYFTYQRGTQDANNATRAALKYKIPSNSIIYFAVDTDPQDGDIKNKIIPYFNGIKDTMDSALEKYYRIGIYATRNACQQVLEKNLVTTCFVSDMSTGFSGNMGFNIPENWNLDQFYEIKGIVGNEGKWDLDKVSYSGKYPVVNSLSTSVVFDSLDLTIKKLYKISSLANYYYSKISNKISPEYLLLHYFRYLGGYGGKVFTNVNVPIWNEVAGEIDMEFCSYVEQELGKIDCNFFHPHHLKSDEFIEYDFNHFVAIVNSLLYKFGDTTWDLAANLYTGWGGDVLSFAETYVDLNPAGDMQTWFDNNICTEGIANFPIEDYYADLDAINVVNIMKKENVDFLTAFSQYFDSPEKVDGTYKRRTTLFISNYGTSYFETLLNTLLDENLELAAIVLSSLKGKKEHFEASVNAFRKYVYKEYSYSR